MHYALLGDIHSSQTDLKAVLAQISEEAPEVTIVGTGDLFECTISKKDITEEKFTKLEDVMLIPGEFTNYLTFPSVRGNQEERILLITNTDNPLRDKIRAMPEKIQIDQAEVIHGHQWKWGGNPWTLIQAEIKSLPVFYGHSHQSSLVIDGIQEEIKFDMPYTLEGNQVLINVGAVIGNREWVLYDSSKKIVIFKRANRLND